jgi:hypothetical protein
MVMVSLPRMQLLGLAAAGVLFTLSVTLTMADELATNLGPVGPNEPILTTVGGKRIIAFYMQDSGRCALHAVSWDSADADSVIAKIGPDPADAAIRVRISLNPGQVAHIDTADNKSLNLKCGKDAEKLAVIDTDSAVAFGIATQQPGKPVKASASGF